MTSVIKQPCPNKCYLDGRCCCPRFWRCPEGCVYGYSVLNSQPYCFDHPSLAMRPAPDHQPSADAGEQT